MNNPSHILEWLKHPNAPAYFGEGFRVKLLVLDALRTGECLAEVARKHGVSKQAVYKQAKIARAMFPL